VAHLPGAGFAVTALAVSSDRRSLLAAGIDRALRLWEPPAERAATLPEGHAGPVHGVAFVGSGIALSVGQDGRLVRWNLATRHPVAVIRAHDDIAWAVAATPDGRFALTAGKDGTVRLWHLATGDRIGAVAPPDDPKAPWRASRHPGARLFRTCAACHSLSAEGAERAGPHLAGLIGRRAGSLPGYRYSDVLKAAEFIWTEATLASLFREGPDKLLPGTKMPLQRITDEEQLAHLVEFLREATTAPAAR
jgi:cytochrome c